MVQVSKNAIIKQSCGVVLGAGFIIPSLYFGFPGLGGSCHNLSLWLIVQVLTSVAVLLLLTPFRVFIMNGFGVVRGVIVGVESLFRIGWCIYGATIAWSSANDLHCRYDSGRPVWILSTITIIFSLLLVFAFGLTIRQEVKDDCYDED